MLIAVSQCKVEGTAVIERCEVDDPIRYAQKAPREVTPATLPPEANSNASTAAAPIL